MAEARAPCRIAVVGAGPGVGIQHCAAIAALAEEQVELAAVCQRRREDQDAATRFGCAQYTDCVEMAREERLDGVVVANPTHMHLQAVKDCIAGAKQRQEARAAAGEAPEAGFRAVLVEKPICGNLRESQELVRCCETSGIAVLVGHQRRHSSFVRRAMELVQSPGFGPLRGVTAEFAILKPEGYYATGNAKLAWRTEPGNGGPVLINLIHDLDLLRHITGHEISKVFAMTSSTARNNAVEDTGSVSLIFDHGALGTLFFSDAAPSPWSYEFTTLENKKYPPVPGGAKDCYHFLGAQTSLGFPSLHRFGYACQEPGWDSPLTLTEHPIDRVDPIREQMGHFVQVCRGEETPICTGNDAIASLAVAAAVLQSAETGLPVQPGDMLSLKLRVPSELRCIADKSLFGQGRLPMTLSSTACSAPGGPESESDVIAERHRVTMASAASETVLEDEAQD